MHDIAYKLTILLQRRPDIAPDDFTQRWLEAEAADPVDIAGLAGYVFNRSHEASSPLPAGSGPTFDAAVETWWQRKNDAADWVVSAGFERWLTKRLPLLASRPAAVGGEPQVIWKRELPAGASPVKLLVLPVALRRLRFQEFVAHWTSTHAALALEGPGAKDRLIRLEDTPAPIAPPSRFERTRFDGVGAITFESTEALTAEFESAYYRSTLAPDEQRFVDAAFSSALLTTPVPLR